MNRGHPVLRAMASHANRPAPGISEEVREFERLFARMREELPFTVSSVICSLCQCPFKDAVSILTCGHHFCRECLLEEGRWRQTCPECAAPYYQREVTASTSVQAFLDILPEILALLGIDPSPLTAEHDPDDDREFSLPVAVDYAHFAPFREHIPREPSLSPPAQPGPALLACTSEADPPVDAEMADLPPAPPGRQKRRGRAAPVESPPATSPEEHAPAQKACQACTLLNPPRARLCRACRTPLAPRAPIAEIPPDASASGRPAKRPRLASPLSSMEASTNEPTTEDEAGPSTPRTREPRNASALGRRAARSQRLPSDITNQPSTPTLPVPESLLTSSSLSSQEEGGRGNGAEPLVELPPSQETSTLSAGLPRRSAIQDAVVIFSGFRQDERAILEHSLYNARAGLAERIRVHDDFEDAFASVRRPSGPGQTPGRGRSAGRASPRPSAVLADAADTLAVTHLVAKCSTDIISSLLPAMSTADALSRSAELRTCKRTGKYLQALAIGGIWIVDEFWFSESCRRGRLLAESPFEVLGDRTCGITRGPELARTGRTSNTMGLFRGTTFDISLLPAGLRHQMASLLPLAGGIITQRDSPGLLQQTASPLRTPSPARWGRAGTAGALAAATAAASLARRVSPRQRARARQMTPVPLEQLDLSRPLMLVDSRECDAQVAETLLAAASGPRGPAQLVEAQDILRCISECRPLPAGPCPPGGSSETSDSDTESDGEERQTDDDEADVDKEASLQSGPAGVDAVPPAAEPELLEPPVTPCKAGGGSRGRGRTRLAGKI
ncbi:hypothetical protein H696_00245 [Fonticula alba]|uniref:Uncharacterized protein n=1 Tax=Fonticula alba TaxID=691883 RepID=A0A058ZE36_FONAL|nr:hypothetical protein H696_00245 [Fonticula alba]KCV72665.1 hypothetical protein H696_00245 [Fonticula alba]|eukprot:XP_009492366.1 hypothetical protein H696_00245 [Fonticula alba]